LTLVVFVAVSPYFVYQAIRYKKYIGSLRQRLGFLPISFNIDGDESIWIHAVSVGEALTARALASDLKSRYPRLKLYLSTTTMAGQQVARSSLRHLVDGVFYFPFDWMFTIRRTLNLVKPRLFIMLETEIWPNLLHECRKRHVKTAVINGRISARSYPRYKLIRPFFRRVLADVDRFCMQSEESAHRLKDLGADAGRVTVTGSLKFDSLELPSAVHGKSRERVLRFFRLSSRRTVLVAGSTMRGEETAVLQAFKKIKTTQTHAIAIIAPRQPERFGEVERLSREAGFVTIRRSELPIDAEPRADVVVLDTIGELAQLYQLATAVFVGGSLADHGGHNILEPAIYGKPIVFGPHMQNFREIAEAFVANDAAIQVQSERELDAAMLSLVRDPVHRARLGAAARALVEANRGAKDKTLAVLADLLPPAGSGGVVRPFRLVH
jgi:3-deoxy-D-manno-octulosonic-acid transferase